MARSRIFSALTRSIRTALTCEAEGIETREGVARAQEGWSRRKFLGVTGATAGAAALAGCGLSVEGAGATGRALRSLDVGIVGAGLAGLACADELQRLGIVATLHEWSDRAGGRCWSMGGAFPGPVSFPGQVVERGGELIDNLHKTMLGYAQRFDLRKEDVAKVDGEIAYHFDGRAWSEEVVVDEFRDLVAAMHDDLRLLSPPTADSFTPDDERLDFTTLAEWLDTRDAGPVIRRALDVAYNIEFGLEIEEQSCLSLLLFMHADKRSRFLPFGVFSDERYHLVDGNEGIVRGLVGDLEGPIHHGRRLVRVAKLSDGRIELTFLEGRRSVRVVHEAVVLTLPFSTLRDVELHASLGLPDWKLRAIRELRYGTNAKQMVGFTSRPWAAIGSSGSSYSDLPNHQATWETNPSLASASRAVITDYSGGARGAALDPSRSDQAAERFLADLERIYPGAAAAARRDRRGRLVQHLEHWPSSPFIRGSYVGNHPGYFTTIADNEQKPIGNLSFAGEHTSSFYEWQGFMEGACLSGLRAAGEMADLAR